MVNKDEYIIINVFHSLTNDEDI